jgi:rhamnulose-1-phosphate aldolase/alcohol dehydrogenase
MPQYPVLSSPLPALLWMSRACGADESLVLHGGGNSSVKAWGRDYRGRGLRVLHVKGSGSDLRTLEAKHLTPLDLEALRALQGRASLDDDAMVAYLAQAMLDPRAPRGSIETLLHAFLPPTYILHTHADATAALLDTPRGEWHLRRCFGPGVALVPYQRPGFGLSKATAAVYAGAQGALRAILLDKHGLITWGESAQEALAATRALVGQARAYVQGAKKRPRRPGKSQDLAPAFVAGLRGALSQGQRQILAFDRSSEAVQFSRRPDAARLCDGGPATPDHLLYTKPRALFLDPQRRSALRGVEAYRRWYDAYFKAHAGPGLTRLDSAPRVVVIKGFGVVATGKDARAAGIARDIFHHSMWVRSAAAGLGGYRSLGIKAIADFEYWPLENYKLSLAPPERELSRQIALVTGAGRGIGKAIALRLAAAGACVAVLDREAASAKAVAGLLPPGQGLALACDITSEKAVFKAVEKVVMTWGGLDIVVHNAGIARTSAVEKLSKKDWDLSLAVNATGHFLVAKAAAAILRVQGSGGAMVFVSSKNVLAPGKDFAAYSASKAAQTQLAKVLALELAPIQVRVNAVTPDGIFDDSGLWEAIGPERAKTQGVRARDLPDFYRKRNLLARQVRPSDVAEAVLYLAGERASRTTGTLFPVDGGLKEAFPR